MNDIVSLQEILRIEQSISELLKTARNDIIKEIETTEIEGVKKINDFCCVVKLSKLRNNIWSAEYYLPRVQASYVKTALASVKTAAAFVEKVADMVENRRVKIGKNVYYLNDTTVGILMRHYKGLTEEL